MKPLWAVGAPGLVSLGIGNQNPYGYTKFA